MHPAFIILAFTIDCVGGTFSKAKEKDPKGLRKPSISGLNGKGEIPVGSLKNSGFVDKSNIGPDQANHSNAKKGSVTGISKRAQGSNKENPIGSLNAGGKSSEGEQMKALNKQPLVKSGSLNGQKSTKPLNNLAKSSNNSKAPLPLPKKNTSTKSGAQEQRQPSNRYVNEDDGNTQDQNLCTGDNASNFPTQNGGSHTNNQDQEGGSHSQENPMSEFDREEDNSTNNNQNKQSTAGQTNKGPIEGDNDTAANFAIPEESNPYNEYSPVQITKAKFATRSSNLAQPISDQESQDAMDMEIGTSSSKPNGTKPKSKDKKPKVQTQQKQSTTENGLGCFGWIGIITGCVVALAVIAIIFRKWVLKIGIFRLKK